MAERHARSPKGFVRREITISRDLLHSLKLVRAITGCNLNEWMRWQLTIAVQLELANRPGAYWLRPGSRVYRLNWRGEEPIPIPLAVSHGGERVWVREYLPGFDLGEDEGLPAGERDGGAMLCDLSSEEPEQLDMRNVLVAVFDVAPSTPAWKTGLGSVQAAQARERRRRKVALQRLRKGRETMARDP